jgi:hypothetical protein
VKETGDGFVQDPPDGECTQPHRTTSKLESKRGPDKVDEAIDEDCIVLDVGNLSFGNVKFPGPRDEKNGRGQARRVSHQGEENDAKEIGILSPFRPQKRIVRVEGRNREQGLTIGRFVAEFGVEMDCSGNVIFLGVGDGGEDFAFGYGFSRHGGGGMRLRGRRLQRFMLEVGG